MAMTSGASEDLRAGMTTVSEFRAHLAHAQVTTRDVTPSSDASPKAVRASSPVIGRSPQNPEADRRTSEVFREGARYLEKLRGFHLSRLVVTL